MKKPSRVRSILLVVATGIIGTCLCCVIFGVWSVNDPGVQAQKTAQAIAAVTSAAQATEDARPTNTPIPPTKTSTATATQTTETVAGSANSHGAHILWFWLSAASPEPTVYISPW